MRRNYHLLLRLLAGLLLCVTLGKAAIADDLAKVFDLAAKNDPELKAAEANYRAQIESKPQARALLLPFLSLSASQSQKKESGESRQDTNNVSLNLTQPVFNSSLFLKLKQANNTTKKASIDLSLAYQALIVRVTDRYFAMLTAYAKLESARSEKRAFAHQLEQAQKRFEVGLTAITNVHEARAAHDLASAQMIAAENELATRREALRELTNQEHNRLMLLRKDIPLISPHPANPEEWTQTALKQNLSLKSAGFDVDNAKTEIKVQGSGHLPTLDIVASKNQADSTGGSLGASDTDSESVALRLTVPLFQGGYVSSKTRQARAQYQESAENLEKLRRATLKQSRDAYLGVISGISRVQALKQAIISTDSALNATTAGYRVGTRTIVDVLNAQRELTRAKTEYASSRHDYVLNLVRLKQAAGTLALSDLQRINGWLDYSMEGWTTRTGKR